MASYTKSAVDKLRQQLGWWGQKFLTPDAPQQDCEHQPELELLSTQGEERRVYRVKGKLHHPTQPAKTTLLSDGSKIEEYYRNGDRHRQEGPAIITTQTDGTVCCEFWIGDQRHSEKGPAVVIHRIDGTQRHEFWHHMLQHREQGPAVIEYNANKMAIYEEFWQQGHFLYAERNSIKDTMVSVDEIFYDPILCERIRLTTFTDGRTEETHHVKGRLHREDGPARIITSKTGARFEEYWIDGLPLKLDLNKLPSLQKKTSSG